MRASRTRAIPLLGGSVVVVAALGCTEFEPGDDIAQGGTTSSGPISAEGDWDCLPDRVDPPLGALGTRMVRYTLPILNSQTFAPPEGLSVNACLSTDVACATPMATDMRPNADGVVIVPVREKFGGFFTMRSDSTIDSRLFLNGGVEQDTVADPVFLIGRPALAGLAQQAQETIDDTRGQLVVRTYDCSNKLAAGVQVSNDRGGKVYAFVGQLPTPGIDVTDEQGTAGFINVTPGVAVVRGRLAGSNAEIGFNSVPVQAGWFTYVDVRAAP
jgi:hypothetical protein